MIEAMRVLLQSGQSSYKVQYKKKNNTTQLQQSYIPTDVLYQSFSYVSMEKVRVRV